MRRFIVFMLQALARVLRGSAERAQRLADQMQTAFAATPSRDPYSQADSEVHPPEHWLKQAEVHPPEHWLETVRQHAPHLLSEGFPRYETTSEPSDGAPRSQPQPQPQPEMDEPPNRSQIGSEGEPAPAHLRLTPIGRAYKGVIHEISASMPAKLPDSADSVAPVPQIQSRYHEEGVVSPAPERDALEPLASFSDFLTPLTDEQPIVTVQTPDAPIDLRPTEEAPRVPPNVSQVGPQSALQVEVPQSVTPVAAPPKGHFAGGEDDQTRLTRLTSVPRAASPIVPSGPQRPTLQDITPEIELMRTHDTVEASAVQPTESPEPPPADPRSRLSVPPVKPIMTLTTPDSDHANHTDTLDKTRWAPLLEEDEGAMGQPPEADEARDHRRRLDQEQRGQSWNG